MVAPMISGGGIAEPNIFSVHGSLVPSSNEFYNLGSVGAKWKDLYLSGSTIHLGNLKLQATQGGELMVRTNEGGSVPVLSASTDLILTATSNLITNKISPYTGNVIDISGATLCNLSLMTNMIEPVSGGIINMGGSTLSNVTVAGMPAASTTSNVYFYAARGGGDFTLSAGSTIGGWTDALTTQTPAGILNMTTGVFTAPVTGSYTFAFGFRCGESGELRVRINGTDMHNFYNKYYGTVIQRLTAGNTLVLAVEIGSCSFYPASVNNRLWFQGTLTHLG